LFSRHPICIRLYKISTHCFRLTFLLTDFPVYVKRNSSVSLFLDCIPLTLSTINKVANFIDSQIHFFGKPFDDTERKYTQRFKLCNQTRELDCIILPILIGVFGHFDSVVWHSFYYTDSPACVNSFVSLLDLYKVIQNIWQTKQVPCQLFGWHGVLNGRVRFRQERAPPTLPGESPQAG